MALNTHNIPFVLLKGQGLAQLYFNPLGCQLGDLDIYVCTEYYNKTQTLFSANGWLVGNGKHEDMKHLLFN